MEEEERDRERERVRRRREQRGEEERDRERERFRRERERERAAASKSERWVKCLMLCLKGLIANTARQAWLEIHKSRILTRHSLKPACKDSSKKA